MNKIIKITVVAAVAFTATGVFAAPHHKPHHKENNGIRLATDIINLVDSSLRLLTGTPRTVYVNQPAVVAAPAPVVVTQPAPVVVTQPAPTVIVNQSPVVVERNPIIVNQRQVVINNRRPVIKHHNPPPRPKTNYRPAAPRFSKPPKR